MSRLTRRIPTVDMNRVNLLDLIGNYVGGRRHTYKHFTFLRKIISLYERDSLIITCSLMCGIQGGSI